MEEAYIYAMVVGWTKTSILYSNKCLVPSTVQKCERTRELKIRTRPNSIGRPTCGDRLALLPQIKDSTLSRQYSYVGTYTENISDLESPEAGTRGLFRIVEEIQGIRRSVQYAVQRNTSSWEMVFAKTHLF